VEHPERREEVRRTTGGFTAQGALSGTGASTPVAGEPETQAPARGGAEEVE
jgi:hypothetical protein